LLSALEDLLCNTVQTKARSIIACSLLENSAPIVYTMLIVRITEYNPIFRLHAVTSFFPLNGCICNQYRVCYVVYLLLVCSVLYILFKTFVLFLWSFCFLYRLIVCTLLMRFNGFKLVYGIYIPFSLVIAIQRFLAFCRLCDIFIRQEHYFKYLYIIIGVCTLLTGF
jgi:hypothetical protein